MMWLFNPTRYGIMGFLGGREFDWSRLLYEEHVFLEKQMQGLQDKQVMEDWSQVWY